MTAPSTVDAIKAHLVDLQMPGSLEVIDHLLERVDGGSLSPAAAMEQLLTAQVTLRRHRRLTAAMHSSRLPGVKTLADFDFTFQPSVDPAQIRNLHELTFLERHENILFLGPAGVGKTHLAISLAIT